MRIAYLINQYPKVSHSFIRREIFGVEAAGCEVIRYSIRPCLSELVDPDDIAELDKTEVVLSGGILKLLVNWIFVLASRPAAWVRCFALMLKVASVSDRNLAYHFAYMMEACVLLRRFSQANIEHVHAHFGTNSATVVMLCKVLGGPRYSFTVHGPEEFDKPTSLSLGEKIKYSAFVVAVSSFGKSQLYRWSNAEDWDKVNIIHCGVDQTFLSQTSPIPIPTDPTFVCVGRLSEQKGHLILLEAAHRLAQQEQQFKLVLVGDGSLRPLIETKIKQWQLEDYIEITGWASSSEVRDRILAARALVLPSFAEGLPVVIMESLALSRPVISTYVAGIPELLGPDCGWLVPAANSDELAIAMQAALQMPTEQLDKMGYAGAQKVAQQHSAHTEAHKLVDLFKAAS